MKGESHIPKWAEKFLSWYCRHEILEEIQGDLYELFDKRAKKKSVRFARRRFIWDVLRTFRLSTIKHVQLPNNLAMLSHNLRFTFRRFTRQKLNTSLHLVGLTIGITVCLLIGLFIRHELTYDTYHAKADRIYRVNQVWEVNEEKYLHYGAPTPLAGALREGRPEIEAIGVAFPQNERIVEINPRNKFLQPNIVLADTGLLDVFDFTIIQGDAKRTLSEPNHAILTKSTAEKFFGLQDPIGKTFTYREDKVITVGAIMEDLPTNTHLPASILLTFSKTEDFIVSNLNNWGLVYGASTYVVLGKGVDPTSLHAPIRELYDTHLNDPDEDPEIGYAELQALTNIHTNTEVAGGGKLVKAISPGVLWFFGGISIGVLLLACFNFINLSTTQAITRIKEVGVRKVIGAGRRQLINQFLLEAFVLLGLSALLAVLLTHLLLPEVNGLIKKDIAISSMYQAEFIGLTILCLIAIGLFSGWYPAWLTAKIQPATAVKASYSSSDKTSNWLRKGLVVAQFSLSAGLLLAMIIMSRQMKYFHEANLGFDRENILSFQMPDLKNKDLLEVELAKISGIQQSLFSLGSPAGDNTWTTVMHPTSLNDPERKNVRTIWADQFYQEIFGLEVLAGRFINMSDTSFISSSIPDEEHTPKVVVNETLVKEMGFGTLEEALGKRFLVGVNNWKVEVVGVMKDFNISSLHNEIMPLAIGVYPKQHKEVSIQLAKNIDLPATLREIEAAYTTAFPKNIFQFDFLDDKIERYYESESRLFSLFRIFSWLAMLISCLGLWGLATFATIQRTKEIGIRKVLGASSSMLVGLLSRDFFLMVGVSFLLGAPIAWYGMKGWLQNFAYQIPVHWTIFALSAMAILLIVSTTIGYQTLKAALSDPVKALRYE